MIRGIVIGIKGTFVTVLTIGTQRDWRHNSLRTSLHRRFSGKVCMFIDPHRLNLY
jgi:hypothetical protein